MDYLDLKLTKTTSEGCQRSESITIPLGDAPEKVQKGMLEDSPNTTTVRVYKYISRTGSVRFMWAAGRGSSDGFPIMTTR